MGGEEETELDDVALLAPCPPAWAREPLDSVPCPSTEAWGAPDERAPLARLLTEYAEPIEAITRELGPLIASHPAEDPIQPDQLFVLRHLLSRQSTAAAAVSVKAALEHRRGGQHLALALTVASGDLPPLLKGSVPEEALPCTTTATSFGDIVEFIEHGHSPEYYQFLDSFGEAELLTFITAFYEASYQYLDRTTRRLGYIVKQYVVCDHRHVNVLSVFKKYWHLLPSVRKFSVLSRDVYPQLEAKIILTNSRLLCWMVSILKRFLTKSSAKKLAIQMKPLTDTVDGLPIAGTLGARKTGLRPAVLQAL